MRCYSRPRLNFAKPGVLRVWGGWRRSRRQTLRLGYLEDGIEVAHPRTGHGLYTPVGMGQGVVVDLRPETQPHVPRIGGFGGLRLNLDDRIRLLWVRREDVDRHPVVIRGRLQGEVVAPRIGSRHLRDVLVVPSFTPRLILGAVSGQLLCYGRADLFVQTLGAEELVGEGTKLTRTVPLDRVLTHTPFLESVTESLVLLFRAVEPFRDGRLQTGGVREGHVLVLPHALEPGCRRGGEGGELADGSRDEDNRTSSGWERGSHGV